MATLVKNRTLNASDIGANPTDKITITYADVNTLGAVTSGSLYVGETIAVGDVLCNFGANVTTNFAGTVSALSMTVGNDTTANAWFTTALDLYGGKSYYFGVGTANTTGLYSWGTQSTTSKIKVTFASTGNMGSLTAGSVDIYFTKRPKAQFWF